MDEDIFSYSPLDEAQNQFRLLYPRPKSMPGASEPTDDIIVTPDIALQFELRKVSLDESPDYTALSYVWGNEFSDVPISVNGKHFVVTKNLLTALEHLQYRDIAPAIWIDAICINQKDNTEKSRQVSQMQSIYSGANRVIIWLGPRVDHSNLLAAILELYPTKLAARFGLINPDLDDLIDCLVKFESTNEYLGFLGSILQDVQDDGDDWRPAEFLTLSTDLFCVMRWWSRAWIIQEFVLAEDGHFQIGCRRIGVGAVALLFMTYILHLVPLLRSSSPEVASKILTKRNTVPDYDWPMWLFISKERGVDNKFSLYNLLCQIYCRPSTIERDHLLSATDRRDYIYALYALLPGEFRKLGIQVDYHKNWWELYHEVAYKLVRAGHVDLFALCQWTPQDRELARWTPSWHRRIIYPNAWNKVGQGAQKVLGYSLFSASADTKVQCELMQPEYNELGQLGLFLKMRGIPVDEITETRKVYPRYAVARETLLEARRVLYRSLFRDVRYLSRRSKELAPTRYPYSVLQSAIWKMLVWDHEVDHSSGNVQRATDITRKEFIKCESLSKAVEAYARGKAHSEEANETSLRKSKRMWSWVSSRWCALRSSWHFFTFQNPGTTFLGRQWSWLRALPRWLYPSLQPDPLFEISASLTSPTSVFMLYMECGTPIRPFITASGYIGIGPGDTEPGDKVCLLYGGRIPYVLRPRQDFNHGYSLQGGAYVHGIMDGELITPGRVSEDFDLL